MTEPKILNTSPNPDKLKNKMEIEKKWAESILSKHNEESNDIFIKELDKLTNPIQIWIKGQILTNLGIESADLYKSKATELGYSTESIEERVNTTSFSDGTIVFSTKDKNLAEKIKTLINESYKQEFQYQGEQQTGPWTWNMFSDDENLKISKKEYNTDALIQLINHDPFLKFNYHNLMTGDNDKDLNMIWSKYVKEDTNYTKMMKTYENHVTYYASKNSIKYDFYNRLSKLLESAKILDKVNINDICNLINSFKSLNILESIELNSRIELKNILSELKSDGIVEALNLSQLTYKDFDLNTTKNKISNSFKISENTSDLLYNYYMLPILKESLQFYHIGNKDFTSLFNIINAIILTNDLK